MEITGTRQNSMPELPEVQTVVLTLKQQIQHQQITNVIVSTNRIILQDVSLFKKSLMNQRFEQFLRRGKYIVLKLSKGYLVIHLRMEGRFFLKDVHEPSKHVHVVFELDHKRYMHYQDTRKFGHMIYLPTKEDLEGYFAHLGLEVTDSRFHADYLYQITRRRSRSIKSLLLSQDIVAGIGNIYADEICFAAKVHPNQSVSTISKAKYGAIVEACSTILDQATRLGGSSIRSYTDSLGVTGRFQLSLNVHMQKDQPCRVCQTLIIKTVVANRGTYLCPTCQKLKK